jgi:hypothetical protein
MTALTSKLHRRVIVRGIEFRRDSPYRVVVLMNLVLDAKEEGGIDYLRGLSYSFVTSKKAANTKHKITLCIPQVKIRGKKAPNTLAQNDTTKKIDLEVLQRRRTKHHAASASKIATENSIAVATRR